jgi:hypothetical protein
MAMIWIIGVSTYIIRNIVELIPSPFEGIQGLIHKRVKELGSAGVYTLILMNSTAVLSNKLKQFNHELNTYLNIKIENVTTTLSDTKSEISKKVKTLENTISEIRNKIKNVIKKN